MRSIGHDAYLANVRRHSADGKTVNASNPRLALTRDDASLAQRQHVCPPGCRYARFSLRFSDLSPCFDDVCQKQRPQSSLAGSEWVEWIEGTIEFSVQFVGHPPSRQTADVSFVVAPEGKRIPQVRLWSGWDGLPEWLGLALKGSAGTAAALSVLPTSM